MTLNYKCAFAAIAIPEVCRFVAAYSGTTKSDELFENYFGLNPLGICNILHQYISNPANHFSARDALLVSLGFALGIATPVACYFAVSKPKSILTIAPALILCAIQSGCTYLKSIE